MAKGASGGRRRVAAPTPAARTSTPTASTTPAGGATAAASAPAPATTTPTGSVGKRQIKDTSGQAIRGAYNVQELQNATSAQQAQVIKQINSRSQTGTMPDAVDSSNAFQRLSYTIGGDGAPQVVDSATFNATPGKTLYRTVNVSPDASAQQIVFDTLYNDTLRFSGQYSSAYGSGIYFADDARESSSYGSSTKGVSKMMRTKIAPNAKTIDATQLRQEVRREMQSNTAIGKELTKIANNNTGGGTQVSSIYARIKGYDIITTNNGTGYFVVLNRGALIMDATAKDCTRGHPPRGWK